MVGERDAGIMNLAVDEKIANEALHLAMEWGEDFMKPTQPRLRKLHPRLTRKKLDEYDAVARAAMNFGHNYLYDRPDSAFDTFAEEVRRQAPWASGENLSRLYTQGQYYAHK